eukprot:TRINITY_DN32527_c0_g1_i1.p1 TRINITY_DN32527_c0_g1~~TRINITY_DN32527_c0_g1_i1.p1  ORF type:complete len:264 (-),score=63.76 TRINITY_DN32527_c0_g1_i1:153-914(-)
MAARRCQNTGHHFLDGGSVIFCQHCGLQIPKMAPATRQATPAPAKSAERAEPAERAERPERKKRERAPRPEIPQPKPFEWDFIDDKRTTKARELKLSWKEAAPQQRNRDKTLPDDVITHKGKITSEALRKGGDALKLDTGNGTSFTLAVILPNQKSEEPRPELVARSKQIVESALDKQWGEKHIDVTGSLECLWEARGLHALAALDSDLSNVKKIAMNALLGAEIAIEVPPVRHVIPHIEIYKKKERAAEATE